MATPALYSLHATVTMTDGTELEAKAIQPDLIRYEDVARQRGWGGPDVAPMRWATFVAWAALRRTHEVADEFDTWMQSVATIEPIDGSDDAVVAVDPTQPEAG